MSGVEVVGALVVAALLWPGRGSRRWPGRHLKVLPTVAGGHPSAARDPWSVPTRTGTLPHVGWPTPQGQARASPLEVAAAIDLIMLSLAGGGGVVEAVEGVAKVAPSPLSQRLATVVAAVRWGLPWEQAWALAGKEWRRVGAAFALAEEIGIAPTAPLARASADLRTGAQQEANVAAARLGVRLVMPLGLTFLPAFVLLTVVPLVVALASQLLAA